MENVEFFNSYKYLITFYLINTCTFHSVSIAYRSDLLSFRQRGNTRLVAARYSAAVQTELETFPAPLYNVYRLYFLSFKPSPLRINQALILRHGKRKIGKEALLIILTKSSTRYFSNNKKLHEYRPVTLMFY